MSDEHAHDSHHVNYRTIFIALCICTLLSIAFDLGKDVLSRYLLVTLVLAVAVCKATFVLLYFMHIKFEAGWKYVLLAPTMVLACALPFALAPDMAFHYYFVAVPQSIAAAEVAAAGADHRDAHGADSHAGDQHAGYGHDEHAKKTEGHGAKKESAPAKTEAHAKPKAEKKHD